MGLLGPLDQGSTERNKSTKKKVNKEALSSAENSVKSEKVSKFFAFLNSKKSNSKDSKDQNASKKLSSSLDAFIMPPPKVAEADTHSLQSINSADRAEARNVVMHGYKLSIFGENFINE